MMNDLYLFIYKGILTEESLDKSGRKKHKSFNREEAESIKKALSYEMLDHELMVSAEMMSIIYIALHVFENMVRDFVKKVMVEKYHENWWTKVQNKIVTKVEKRIEEEAKFRWHGARGGSEIEYCDFGDLASIIVVNRDAFEDVLTDIEWVKGVLTILERSRNVIMHGGILERQDIERIGINIRDWIRQVG